MKGHVQDLRLSQAHTRQLPPLPAALKQVRDSAPRVPPHALPAARALGFQRLVQCLGADTLCTGAPCPKFKPGQTALVQMVSVLGPPGPSAASAQNALWSVLCKAGRTEISLPGASGSRLTGHWEQTWMRVDPAARLPSCS